MIYYVKENNTDLESELYNFNITEFKVNEDDTISTYQSVDISYKNLNEIPFNFYMIMKCFY